MNAFLKICILLNIIYVFVHSMTLSKLTDTNWNGIEEKKT